MLRISSEQVALRRTTFLGTVGKWTSWKRSWVGVMIHGVSVRTLMAWVCLYRQVTREISSSYRSIWTRSSTTRPTAPAAGFCDGVRVRAPVAQSDRIATRVVMIISLQNVYLYILVVSFKRCTGSLKHIHAGLHSAAFRASKLVPTPRRLGNDQQQASYAPRASGRRRANSVATATVGRTARAR